MRHPLGVQNFLADLPAQEQNNSAVVCAGNSGLPGGAVGKHIKLIQPPFNFKSYDDLLHAPARRGGTYITQEEDVVKNWLLSELATSSTSLSESMDLFFKEYGMEDYESLSPNTIQGVNYTSLKDSSPITLQRLRSLSTPENPPPLERLYAHAVVVRNTRLRPKIRRNPDIFDDRIDRTMKTNLVFVAGPNVGVFGDATSTTARTFNADLATNYESFKLAVQWTYYAALYSIAMEGKGIALLPWISGGIYAGPYAEKYGVRQKNESELKEVINNALEMTCFFAGGERSTLKFAFDRVVVVRM